jgi:tripartite-type tricarboxylate transporter receptor subunit TctC
MGNGANSWRLFHPPDSRFPIPGFSTGYDLPAWRSIMGPAGVRRDFVDALNGPIRKTLAMPDIRDKMLGVGSEPMPGKDQ